METERDRDRVKERGEIEREKQVEVIDIWRKEELGERERERERERDVWTLDITTEGSIWQTCNVQVLHITPKNDRLLIEYICFNHELLL